MRLPWVSRAAFDLSQHNNEQLHRLVVEHADQRFADLLEKYHELATRTPAYLTEPHEVGPTFSAVQYGTPENTTNGVGIRVPAEVIPSVVQQAIRDESGGDRRLAGYLQKRARELRAENMRPEDIAAELRRWNTTEVIEEPA